MQASREWRWTTELAAGAGLAVVTLPSALSAGYLAFSPLGASGAGALAGLVAAILGGGAAAALDRSSILTTSPRASSALVIAGAATALASTGLAPEQTAMILPLLVVCAGSWQILFGALGVGRAVRFVPYPVLSGFVSGIALLIIVKQLALVLEVRSLPEVAELASGVRGFPLPRFLFFLAVGGLALLWPRLVPRVPGSLMALLYATALHRWAAVDGRFDLGPTLGGLPSIEAFSWRALGGGIELAVTRADVAAIVLSTSAVLSLLLTIEALLAFRFTRHLSSVEHGAVRGLVVQGAANLLSGVVGGIAVTGSPPQTRAVHRFGGRTRVALLASVASLALLVVFAHRAMAIVPVLGLAGVLAAVSIQALDPWIWEQMRSVRAADTVGMRRRALDALAVALTVATVTAAGSVVLGAVVGFALACVLFAAQMARPLVHRRTTAAAVRSRRVRSRGDERALETSGASTVVLEIEGALFFGSADQLTDEVRDLSPSTRVVLLDCRRLWDVDASGAETLRHAVASLAGSRRILGLCGVSPALRPTLEFAGVPNDPEHVRFFADLESALEWDEEQRIAETTGRRIDGWRVKLEDHDLLRGLESREVDRVARHLRLEKYEPGAVLCREGEPADRLWLLMRGSVSVRVGASEAAGGVRIAARAPGTELGEAALVERGRRSATIVADGNVECFALDAPSLDELFASEPTIAVKLLRNLTRSMVHRLALAATEIGARGRAGA